MKRLRIKKKKRFTRVLFSVGNIFWNTVHPESFVSYHHQKVRAVHHNEYNGYCGESRSYIAVALKFTLLS